MKFSHLHYFVTIAEVGSFQSAAQHLHLSQPTLTRQIRELEKQLGAELFTRAKTGITLTRAGQAALKRARGMLEAREQLQRELLQNQQPQPDSQSRPSAPITSG